MSGTILRLGDLVNTTLQKWCERPWKNKVVSESGGVDGQVQTVPGHGCGRDASGKGSGSGKADTQGPGYRKSRPRLGARGKQRRTDRHGRTRLPMDDSVSMFTGV